MAAVTEKANPDLWERVKKQVTAGSAGDRPGLLHRHLKQRPEGDVTGTRWRKSRMVWGHDPLAGA